jgi:hypothetical protein
LSYEILNQVVASDSMAQIIIRCSESEHQRIKSKAATAKTSMNRYLLKKGLEDGRRRDSEDSTTLAALYAQLLELNQHVKDMSETEFQQQAVCLCEAVGREVVLYRLARQVEQNS